MRRRLEVSDGSPAVPKLELALETLQQYLVLVALPSERVHHWLEATHSESGGSPEVQRGYRDALTLLTPYRCIQILSFLDEVWPRYSRLARDDSEVHRVCRVVKPLLKRAMLHQNRLRRFRNGVVVHPAERRSGYAEKPSTLWDACQDRPDAPACIPEHVESLLVLDLIFLMIAVAITVHRRDFDSVRARTRTRVAEVTQNRWGLTSGTDALSEYNELLREIRERAAKESLDVEAAIKVATNLPRRVPGSGAK